MIRQKIEMVRSVSKFAQQNVFREVGTESSKLNLKRETRIIASIKTKSFFLFSLQNLRNILFLSNNIKPADILKTKS
jgi:hypothetical protein